MHKDNAEKILLDAGGLTYVHAKLNQSKKSPPTAENLRLVEAIMQRAGPSHKVVLAALYEDAIAWRDLSLWKRIITIYSQPSSSNSWKRVPEAVATFGFEVLRARSVQAHTILRRSLLIC